MLYTHTYKHTLKHTNTHTLCMHAFNHWLKWKWSLNSHICFAYFDIWLHIVLIFVLIHGFDIVYQWYQRAIKWHQICALCWYNCMNYSSRQNEYISKSLSWKLILRNVCCTGIWSLSRRSVPSASVLVTCCRSGHTVTCTCNSYVLV